MRTPPSANIRRDKHMRQRQSSPTADRSGRSATGCPYLTRQARKGSERSLAPFLTSCSARTADPQHDDALAGGKFPALGAHRCDAVVAPERFPNNEAPAASRCRWRSRRELCPYTGRRRAEPRFPHSERPERTVVRGYVLANELAQQSLVGSGVIVGQPDGRRAVPPCAEYVAR